MFDSQISGVQNPAQTFMRPGGVRYRGVRIVGMHRSGTSLVAGSFAAGGYFVGLRDVVMEPDPTNPRGFFERRDVQVLNDRLLNSLASNWRRPPVPELVSAEQARLSSDVADVWAKIVAEASGNPIVLKDPRIALLLPAWNAVIGSDLLDVLVVRDPVAIAKSLHRRDGIPLQLGLAIWELTLTSALNGLEGRTVVVLQLDAIVSHQGDLLAESQDARALLRLNSLPDPHPDLFENSLLHFAPAPDEVLRLCSRSQLQLWDYLQSLTSVHHAFQPPAAMMSWPAAAAEAVAGVGALYEECKLWESRSRDLETAHRELSVDVQEREREIAQLGVGVDRLGSELDNARGAETRVREALLAAEGSLRSFAERVELLEVELRDARNRGGDRDRLASDLGVAQAELAALRAENSELYERSLAAQRQEAEAREALLAAEAQWAGRVAGLEGEAVVAREGLTACQARVDELAAKLEDARLDVEFRETTINRLLDLLDSLHSRVHSAETRSNELAGEMDRVVASHDSEIRRLEQQLLAAVKEAAELDELRRELEGAHSAICREVEIRRRAEERLMELLDKLQKQIGEAEEISAGRIDALQTELAFTRSLAAELGATINGVLGSRSWRITGPLRRAAERIRGRKVGSP